MTDLIKQNMEIYSKKNWRKYAAILFLFYDKIIYNFTVTNHARNKQPQGGLVLKDYLLDVMQQHEHSLYMCELPTGNGKTYDSARAMKEYADLIGDDTKIIYLTTLNKNLPEDALRAAYGSEAVSYTHLMKVKLIVAR